MLPASGHRKGARISRKCAHFFHSVTFVNDEVAGTSVKTRTIPRNLLQSVGAGITVSGLQTIFRPGRGVSPEQKPRDDAMNGPGVRKKREKAETLTRPWLSTCRFSTKGGAQAKVSCSPDSV